MRIVLLSRIKKIYADRLIIWKMSLSMFKAKYIGSKLGIWTAVMNPLLIMFAVSFVFVKVFNVDIEHFPLFVLSAILPWIFFSGTLTEAAGSISGKQSLLHQYNFSREVLPLASVISSFLSFLIGWVVVLLIFLAYNSEIIWLLPHLFLVLMLLVVFTSGLSLAVSVLNALSRDVEQLLGVILMLWFWITPIFYSLDMVPFPYRIICILNPATPFIVSFRQILFYGVVPRPAVLISVLALAGTSIIIGLVVFASLQRQVSKEV